MRGLVSVGRDDYHRSDETILSDGERQEAANRPSKIAALAGGHRDSPVCLHPLQICSSE